MTVEFEGFFECQKIDLMIGGLHEPNTATTLSALMEIW